MPVEKAFFCIPDITGFTNFINSIDIEHAQKIIPAILQCLMESNDLEMEVAEIQGDAIFFYKLGDIPDYAAVIGQCCHFIGNFNKTLTTLSEEYREKIGEYDLKKHLGLKIVVHYGDLALASVAGINKLYGKDIIRAIELLKNSVPHREYVLFSCSYLDEMNSDYDHPDLVHFIDGEDNYEKIGRISYKYISASDLLKAK